MTKACSLSRLSISGRWRGIRLDWHSSPHTRVTKQNIKMQKSRSISATAFFNMVGEEGFEPPTLWSQTRCATKLRYSPTYVLFRFYQNWEPKLPIFFKRKMGWLTRFELATTGITIQGSTNWAIATIISFSANFSLTEVSVRMARLKGFEPSAFGSGGQRSIQLSYRRMPCRRSGIIRISPNAV